MVIEKRNLDKTDRLINVLLYALTLAFLGLKALKLNNPPVLDEVGTMANAAYMAGYDWSECVQSMGSHYYKIGIALLYYPAFRLIRDSFVLYRTCIFINMALISFIPVFAHIILKKYLLPTSEKKGRGVITERVVPALIAHVVGLLPSVDLHSMYAKSDPMLIFLPWPIMLCIFEGLDADEAGKKTKLRIMSVLAAFLSVYAYLSHTRGIVVIIALLMTNICMQLFTGRRPFAWIPYLASTGVFLVAERFISRYFREHVIIYGTRHGTLETAGLEELRNLFTRSGLFSMIKLVLGWFYNVFVASYGMIVIGLIAALIIIFRTFAYKKAYGSREAIPCGETAVAAFSFLNFCGSFAMGALFFFRPVYEFFMDGSLGRADRVVFGRYTVCTVGPLVMLALFCLIYRTGMIGLKTKIVSAALYLAVFLMFVFYVSPWIDGKSANSRYFISLCTFMEYPYNGGTSNPIPNMVEALRWAGELAGGVFALVLVFTSKKITSCLKNAAVYCVPVILAVVSVYSAVIVSVNFTDARLARDSFLYRRVLPIAEILNDVAEKTDIEEKYPYVLNIDTTIEIKHFQAACPAYNYGNHKSLAAVQDNMFIVAEKDRFLSFYCDDDYYLFDSINYKKAFKNIVYVKGDELAEDLRAAGYSLTKYSGKLLEGKH